MSHKYYSDDTEQRKKYFDSQFIVNSNKISRLNNIPLTFFLSKIKDFDSFKEILKQAWSIDTSLLAYYDGMGDEELLEFYERPIIQNILNRNIDISIPETIPIQITQVKKKGRKIFKAKIKGKSTFAYEDKINIRGKSITVYRDSKGRFASKR